MALEGTDAGTEPAPPVVLDELPPAVPLLLEDPVPLVCDPPVPLLLLELPLLIVELPVAGAATTAVVRTPPQPLDMASPTKAVKNRGALRKEGFIESP